MPPLLLTRRAHYIAEYGNCIQNGPHDCRGLDLPQGSKAKPTSQVKAAPLEQSEGQSDIKGGQQLARSGLHRGA
jgi:hypothetical protein